MLFQMCYNVIQSLLFAVLAVLIMRLKLFLTPHLAVTAGLLCSKKVNKHKVTARYAASHSVARIEIKFCIKALSLFW